GRLHDVTAIVAESVAFIGGHRGDFLVAQHVGVCRHGTCTIQNLADMLLDRAAGYNRIVCQCREGVADAAAVILMTGSADVAINLLAECHQVVLGHILGVTGLILGRALGGIVRAFLLIIVISAFGLVTIIRL